jgi:hypothetical protein
MLEVRQFSHQNQQKLKKRILERLFSLLSSYKSGLNNVPRPNYFNYLPFR